MSGLRERVEALAAEWESVDDAKPYAMTHIADCADDLRDALTTADEPTALAGYMVAPDAYDNLAIWRTDELFPTEAIRQSQIDPALWDVLVAAVERGQA